MPQSNQYLYNGFIVSPKLGNVSIRSNIPRIRHTAQTKTEKAAKAYINKWWKDNPPKSIVVLKSGPGIKRYRFEQVVLPCCGDIIQISIRQLNRWKSGETKKCFACNHRPIGLYEPPPVYPPLWEVPPTVLELQHQYGRHFQWIKL